MDIFLFKFCYKFFYNIFYLIYLNLIVLFIGLGIMWILLICKKLWIVRFFIVVLLDGKVLILDGWGGLFLLNIWIKFD